MSKGAWTAATPQNLHSVRVSDKHISTIKHYRILRKAFLLSFDVIEKSKNMETLGQMIHSQGKITLSTRAKINYTFCLDCDLM